MKFIKLFEDLSDGYKETHDYIYEYIDFDDKEIIELASLGFKSIWTGKDVNKCIRNIGDVLDPTSNQFNSKVPYEKGKLNGMMNYPKGGSKRAIEIINRIK